MKLLTTRRSDFAKVNELLPRVSLTGDDKRIFWNITDKQYKYVKDFLPEHIIFDLPKTTNNEQSKSNTLPKVRKDLP